MNDPVHRLRELDGEVPLELMAHFQQTADGRLAGHLTCEVNLLSADEVAETTAVFRDFHDVVIGLQGFVLDDANTSNHHVYLGLPACCGAILFLDHDGDSRIAFRTLSDFVTACEQAVKTGSNLRTYHPPAAILLENQGGLRQLIVDLLDERLSVDATMVLICLIPSLALADDELFRRLAQHEDFYIAEAVGDAIVERPSDGLQSLAQLCAAHAHPQAAEVGRRALAAIADRG